MLENLINLLFRCQHRNLSRPMGTGETYVVCLDCGKRFAYDWKEMRVGAQVKYATREPGPVYKSV